MTTYRVVVVGHLSGPAATALADLGAAPVGEAGAVSTLEVADQSALVGLVTRMHDLGLVIDHVDRVG